MNTRFILMQVDQCKVLPSFNDLSHSSTALARPVNYFYPDLSHSIFSSCSEPFNLFIILLDQSLKFDKSNTLLNSGLNRSTKKRLTSTVSIKICLSPQPISTREALDLNYFYLDLSPQYFLEKLYQQLAFDKSNTLLNSGLNRSTKKRLTSTVSIKICLSPQPISTREALDLNYFYLDLSPQYFLEKLYQQLAFNILLELRYVISH